MTTSLSSMNNTGLILFAHGARDPRWAAPFEAVAARVRAQRPGVPVRLAFLEIMTPGLLEAGNELVRCGCTRIEVLPLFLGAGGHVRKDLRALADALCAAQPQLQLALHPAIGEIEGVVAAMAAAALNLVATGEAA